MRPDYRLPTTDYAHRVPKNQKMAIFKKSDPEF